MIDDLYACFDDALGSAPIGDDGRLGAWLARRGMSYDRRRLVGGIGITRATFSRATMTWEPHPEGDRALVAPVWNGAAPDIGCPAWGWHPSELVDLVGWRPDSPDRLFLRTGIATHIGADGLRQALETASPLRVHRTVESFVKAGGETSGEHPGIVILNHGFTHWLLRHVAAVIADNLEHGEEIEAALLAQRPALPPICIPAERLEAAA